MQLPESFVFAMPKEYRGHAHFWERAMSRRQFLGTSAVAGGVAVSAPLWGPALAQASDMVDPRPIPQVIQPGAPFHVQLLGTTTNPSSITDFRGLVGGVDLLGTGVGTNTTTNEQTALFTAVDNRFMTGTYVGVDGHRHHGTFGFV